MSNSSEARVDLKQTQNQQPAAAEATRKNCPSCGALNKKEARFCSKCGVVFEQTQNQQLATAEATQNYCPYCGNLNKKEARFCKQCGEHFEQTQAQQLATEGEVEAREFFEMLQREYPGVNFDRLIRVDLHDRNLTIVWDQIHGVLRFSDPDGGDLPVEAVKRNDLVVIPNVGQALVYDSARKTVALVSLPKGVTSVEELILYLGQPQVSASPDTNLQEASERGSGVEGVGVASIESPYHPNQDACEVLKLQDGSTIYVMIDGSGGALKDTALSEEDQGKAISEKIELLVKHLKQLESLAQCNHVTSQFVLSEIHSWLKTYGEGVYCTAMAVKKSPTSTKPEVSWVGDVSLLGYNDGALYEHRRNPALFNDNPGNPSVFQMLNFPENQAMKFKARGQPIANTAELDVHPLANEITNCLGNRDFPPTIRTTEIDPSQHTALIMCTDGARPSFLSSLEGANERGVVLSFFDRLKDSFLGLLASTGEPTASRSEKKSNTHEGMIYDAFKRAASNSESMKDRLSNLAQDIAQAARQAGDDDDITVLILNLKTLTQQAAPKVLDKPR